MLMAWVTGRRVVQIWPLHQRGLNVIIRLGHPLVKLVGAVLLVQLAYWFLFYPNMVRYAAPDRPDFLVAESVELATLDSADPTALKTAKWAPYDNGSKLFETGHYATRVTFDLDEVPASGIAVLDMASGDNIQYVVNGQLHSSVGSMDVDRPTYHGLQKRITQVAPAFLRDGSNTIDSLIVFGLARDATVHVPYLAEYKAAERAFGWTDFLFNELRDAMVAVTFAIALLVGVVAIRSHERSVPLWLFLLTFSWALHSLFYRWADMPFHGQTRGFVYAAVLLFMSACWPAFVDAWTGRPLRFFKAAIMAICAVSVAYVGYLLLFEGGVMAFPNTEDLLDPVGLIFVAATVGRLVWHFATERNEQRHWEAALLILLASLMGFFLINTLVYGRNIGVLPASQPLLLVAITTAFFARNFRLFRSSNEISRMLKIRLDEREAELATAHARETNLVRRETLNEERQRIMRDMHDGLGSQLMSMLLAARRGKAEPSRVADGLQQVVDEMRLMIDSMDSLGESLSSALASFRNRLTPRVEDAGFQMLWHNKVEGNLPDFPPRQSLQIFRIMQEAVTNSLKHSGGKEIAIWLVSKPDQPGALQIIIEDDGTGIERKGRRGYGLDNMRARAAAIGAEIAFEEADSGGARLRLSIPAQPM